MKTPVFLYSLLCIHSDPKKRRRHVKQIPCYTTEFLRENRLWYVLIKYLIKVENNNMDIGDLSLSAQLG